MVSQAELSLPEAEKAEQQSVGVIQVVQNTFSAEVVRYFGDKKPTVASTESSGESSSSGSDSSNTPPDGGGVIPTDPTAPTDPTPQPAPVLDTVTQTLGDSIIFKFKESVSPSSSLGATYDGNTVISGDTITLNLVGLAVAAYSDFTITFTGVLPLDKITPSGEADRTYKAGCYSIYDKSDLAVMQQMSTITNKKFILVNDIVVGLGDDFNGGDQLGNLRNAGILFSIIHLHHRDIL